MNFDENLNSFKIWLILKKNGLKINVKNLEILENWVTLIIEFNKKINLISSGDIFKIWEKHILHSLTLLVFYKIPLGSHICDFGTGSGLPGMPIGICRPDLKLTLLDSKLKKIKVIDKILKKLKLNNFKTICSRGEDIKNLNFKKKI